MGELFAFLPVVYMEILLEVLFFSSKEKICPVAPL